MELYHFTPTKYALKAIRDRRLKATELDKANDPFELLPYRNETRESFQEYSRCRTAMDWVMLCLSKTYKNPLLWGHYADKGKGICLGFDVIVNDGSPVPRAFEVDYKTDRIEAGYKYCGLEEGKEIFFPSKLMPGLIKFREWEYEEEWRMWGDKAGLELNPITGLYFFPFEDRLTLRKILIGPRCEEENIERRLERLIGDYDPKPKIFYTRRSLSAFEIERGARVT